MSSTNHEPPDYTIFSCLILPPTSYTKISTSAPFSNALTPNAELKLQYGNLYATWVGI